MDAFIDFDYETCLRLAEETRRAREREREHEGEGKGEREDAAVRRHSVDDVALRRSSSGPGRSGSGVSEGRGEGDEGGGLTSPLLDSEDASPVARSRSLDDADPGEGEGKRRKGRGAGPPPAGIREFFMSLIRWDSREDDDSRSGSGSGSEGDDEGEERSEGRSEGEGRSESESGSRSGSEAGATEFRGLGLEAEAVAAAAAAEEEVALPAAPSFAGGDASELLDTREGMSGLLHAALPVGVRGRQWRLLYGSARDGWSIHTLFRKVARQGPSVLVLRDAAGGIFGGFASKSWQVQEHYFGDGDSFLFTFVAGPGMAAQEGAEAEAAATVFSSARPVLRVGRATGKNRYFMLAREDSLAFGGGGTGFGLRLDEELLDGATGKNDTYDLAGPLCSATADQDAQEEAGREHTAHFRCTDLEVWGFVGSQDTPSRR